MFTFKKHKYIINILNNLNNLNNLNMTLKTYTETEIDILNILNTDIDTTQNEYKQGKITKENKDKIVSNRSEAIKLLTAISIEKANYTKYKA